MLAFAFLAPASHHHDAGAICGGHVVTAKQTRGFAAKVWDLDRWRRGAPSERVRKAHHRHLRCAAGPNHRKVIRHRWRAHKRAFYRHRAYKLRWGDCTDAGPVPDCIHGAALTYGADESWMLRVSYCESTWNRYATNGSSGSTGLFQFLPSTWATTPYAGRSIWSVRWQSLAAAWMFVSGRSGEWVCQ